MLKHIQHIAKIILLLNSIWEDFIYEKMNYTGGAYVTDTRTISASEVSAYNYIHLS